MADAALPPLPQPFLDMLRLEVAPMLHDQWAAQIRAYAREAGAAERERCAKLCDEMGKDRTPADCATAIRAIGK